MKYTARTTGMGITIYIVIPKPIAKRLGIKRGDLIESEITKIDDDKLKYNKRGVKR